MRYVMFVFTDPEGEQYVPEEASTVEWVGEMDRRNMRILDPRLKGAKDAPPFVGARGECWSPTVRLPRRRNDRRVRSSRVRRPRGGRRDCRQDLETVAWKNTRIVRDIEEIRQMKQRPGKDMRVGGGATLLGSLMNHGLIDELRLVVYPIVLGGGMALLQDVMKRHAFTFPWVKP
jgi:riboflavin biosynthesis pyrimidine reductase